MSKSKLKSALYSVNQFINSIDNYSFASRADMRHMLNRCIKDLHQLGYKLGHIKGLKPKHIHILVEHWQQQDKQTATIKNYMSKLRKTAVLLNKPNLVKSKNDDYNISNRSYIPTENKAIFVLDVSKCTDMYIQLSLEAQALFGLRREESMKLVLSEAWQQNKLVIQPSWTKGGIGRTLPITSHAQYEWLKKASEFVGSARSLIPTDRSYKQHLRHYQTQTQLMGISKLHGLRHAYAQKLYHELTAKLSSNGSPLLCPIQGGKPFKELTAQEKMIDRTARSIISSQLGHSRIAITKIYLG